MSQEIIVKRGESRTVRQGEVAHALWGSNVRGLPGAIVHVHAGAEVLTEGCTLFLHPGKHLSIDAGETAYVLPGASAKGRPGSTIHVFPGASISTSGATLWFHAGTEGFHVDEFETAHILPGAHAEGRPGSKLIVYPGARWDATTGVEVVQLDAVPADLVLPNVEEIIAYGASLEPPSAFSKLIKRITG